MADGSFSSGSYVRPYISAHGSPRTLTIQQGSTASTAIFKIGDPIARGATANLTSFLGFAAEAVSATGSLTTKITYWPADNETQFLGVMKTTLASTHLGQVFNLRRDSTLEIAYIDGAVKATGVMAVVDDWAEGSTIGDTNGFVVFRISQVSRQAFPE